MKIGWIFALFALANAASGAALSGTVTEEVSGSAIAHVAINVFRSGADHVLAELETDSSGRFGPLDLAPGDYRIQISKPHFRGSTQRIALAEPTNLSLRMAQLGVIGGSVKTASGRPVLGAVIVAVPKPPDGQPLLPVANAHAAATTDGMGNYRITDLPSGHYAVLVTFGQVRALASQYAVTDTPPALGSGFQYYPSDARFEYLDVSGGARRLGIDFQLDPKPLLSLSATVKVDAALTPSPLAIALYRADQPAVLIKQINRGAGLVATFDGLPPGNYRVAASRATAVSLNIPNLESVLPSNLQPVYAEAFVTLSQKDSPPLTLQAAPGRSARFALNAAPGCPTQVSLTFLQRDGWGQDERKQYAINASQVLSVTGLAPGRYSVRISAPAGGCVAPEEVALDLRGGTPEFPVAIALSPTP